MALASVAASHLLGGLIGSDRVAGAPATFYIGLSSTAPTVSGGVLGSITEPSTGGYARASVANTDAKWTITDGVATNDDDISFPEATGDWNVTPAYFVVFTAATGGTALWSGTLTNATPAYTGVTVTLDAGSIHIQAAS